MDPLDVLPPELVLHMWSFLGIQDLARLLYVSRAWRRVTEHPSLWRGLELDMTSEHHTTIQRILRRAPCLHAISFPSRIGTNILPALLDSDIKVARFENYTDGTKELLPFLVHMAPYLEELRILYPCDEEMSVVHTMLRLHRLCIVNDGESPFVFQFPCRVGKLTWFTHTGKRGVRPDPETLMSFLQANAGTLETLVLEDKKFLQNLTPELWSALTALRHVILSSCWHCAHWCNSSWRLLVPAGVKILCDGCDEPASALREF